MDGSLFSGTVSPAALTPVGFVDRMEAGLVSGWAWVPNDPAAVVQVEIFIDGQLALRAAADVFRRDLLEAGRGTGCYGFAIPGLNVLLDAGRALVSVRFAGGGADLHGSPRWVQPADAALDAAAIRFLGSAVEGAARAASEPRHLDDALALLTRLLGRVAGARATLRGPDRSALDEVAEAGAAAGPVAALAQDVRRRFPPLPLPARPETPEVSVIIPAFGQFALTYACIAAIATAGDAAAVEIILVDDGSADETLLAELVFGGAVRVLRQRRNLGFLHAANAGAAAAGGAYLMFLNNDTAVTPGWMDELLGTLRAMPDVGIAGSALVYPDGSLQECGGIVGRFGEAMNWGRGEDPDDPRFGHLRDADYVSGAALMIGRADFVSLGGFDAAFAPGYYEDTDLCFRMRGTLGRRVVVQPLSRVIHHEGGTAGGDIEAAGPKRAQVVNQRRFHARWRDVLAGHRPITEAPALEAERQVARRAIFVDDVVPAPDRDAGSNAAFSHMRLLQALGCKVSFVAAADPRPRAGYTQALRRIGIECLHAPQVGSVEEAFRRQSPAPDIVYLHRGTNAARYAFLARDHFPDALLVYGVADLHFLRLGREAAVTGDADRAREAARSEAMELHAARLVDRVIVHSTAEATLLAGRVPETRVHVVPWTVTGAPPSPAAGRSGVGFIGGYGHRPNVDAAQYLVREVMPEAWAMLPGLPCLLVGSDMPREVALLAGPAVEALGHVPDLRSVFARVRCSAAPLRFGAGVKGKVLTSLAHGIPCVMSAIAAEGIALPDRLAWLVVDTPAAMAERIVALHRDAALAEEIGAACRDFMREGYGADAVLLRFAAAMGP